MNIKEKQQQFLEHLMARIILSSGRRIEPEKLRNMKLGDLMDLIYPNMIELSSYTVDTIIFDFDDL